MHMRKAASRSQNNQSCLLSKQVNAPAAAAAVNPAQLGVQKVLAQWAVLPLCVAALILHTPNIVSSPPRRQIACTATQHGP